MTKHYEEERLNADIELEVLENDFFAASVLFPMLENIRPLQDVGVDIHRAIRQEGIHFGGGNLSAAVGQNQRTVENPVLRNWQVNLNGRVTRLDSHLEYFQELLESSLVDIPGMRWNVENFTRQRDAAGAMEGFCDQLHAELMEKQDVLKAKLEGLRTQLRMALAIRAAGDLG